MNDGMFIAIRGYLEENSSLLRQILEELKTQKAAPEAQADIWRAPGETPIVEVPPEAVGPVVVEAVATIDKPIGATRKAK